MFIILSSPLCPAVREFSKIMVRWHLLLISTGMMGPRRRMDNQESPRMLMKDEAFPQWLTLLHTYTGGSIMLHAWLFVLWNHWTFMVFHRCAGAVQTSHRILDRFISSNRITVPTLKLFFCFFCVVHYVLAGIQIDKYHYDGFWICTGEINRAAKQWWLCDEWKCAHAFKNE